MENQKAKKPIYKKWWFWILLIIIIGGIAGSSSSEQPKTTLTSSDTSTSTTESTKTIYNVGEIYQNNSVAIKFVSLNDNFTGYNSYASVKSGCKIVKADFEFENLGSSDYLASSFNFSCYADGYDCESFLWTEDSSFTSTLSSGKKAKGSVYFQVPKDATSVTIEYDLNAFTSKKVEFKVK